MHALFTTVRKRLTHGLQFDIDYTYSHSIDNNSDTANQNGNFQPGVTAILCNATNPHECRGNSEFDAKHQITADFVYDLPFGRASSSPTTSAGRSSTKQSAAGRFPASKHGGPGWL